jgi:hypothetical protein
MRLINSGLEKTIESCIMEKKSGGNTMIIFRCTACGNEVEASRESAGKKGKCPTCSSTNVVPNPTGNKLIFDESEIQCTNLILQKVYDEVSALSLPGGIIASGVRTDANGVDLVFFNVRVGDNERKQAVVVTISPPLEGVAEESSVYVYTEIGNLEGASDDLLQALQKITDFWSFNLQMDENYLASLNYSVPLGSVNTSYLAKTILAIAWVADTLEGAILGIDEH